MFLSVWAASIKRSSKICHFRVKAVMHISALFGTYHVTECCQRRSFFCRICHACSAMQILKICLFPAGCQCIENTASGLSIRWLTLYKSKHISWKLDYFFPTWVSCSPFDSLVISIWKGLKILLSEFVLKTENNTLSLCAVSFLWKN